MTGTALEFTVRGAPVPYPRARVNPKTGRFFTPKESVAYRRSIAAEAKSAAAWAPDARKRRDPAWPSEMDCARARHRRKLRRKGERAPKCDCAYCRSEYQVEVLVALPDKRPRDLDNIFKNVGDACTGVLWYDDSQIAALQVLRIYDKGRPRIEVKVRRITAAQDALPTHEPSSWRAFRMTDGEGGGE